MKKNKKNELKPFVNRQLEDSGLTLEDVCAKVYLNDSEEPTFLSPFRKGGIDRVKGKDWIPNTTDDEMLIFYYDRFGKPRKYSVDRKHGDYVRIRYSNPEDHIINGREMKYQSPPGSKAIIYIPQAIRDLLQENQLIDTLIIQEGEKKAEKACKHGLYSVAIQGIWNIGSKDGGIDKELKYLCQELQVKNIVMLMDADFENLSSKIKNDDEITTRPKSFAGAIKKFKRFIKSLNNEEQSIDIWFSHINKNSENAKGIDDLLCTTLKGKEELLKKDLETSMSDILGKGEYISSVLISTMSEYNIEGIWALNDREKFFERHKEELQNITDCKFQKIPYTKVDGKFVNVVSEKYKGNLWEIGINDKGNEKIILRVNNIMDFLAESGYSIYIKDNENDEGVQFIHTENDVSRKISGDRIRHNFIWTIKQATKDETVLNHVINNYCNVLSDQKMRALPAFELFKNEIEEFYQTYTYQNSTIEITNDGVSEELFRGPVWDYQVIKRRFKRIKIIDKIYKDESGDLKIEFTPEAQKCEFLSFLCMTSTVVDVQHNDDDEYNGNGNFELNLMNKITCIGYLLSNFRTKSDSVAIVAQDWTLSMEGKACGGTGKSLLGDALQMITGVIRVDGKQTSSDDKFVFDRVNEKTRVIFFDDVEKDFAYSSLYNVVNSPVSVNPKGKSRYEIPFKESPKIYLASNYAVKDDSDSTDRRLAFMIYTNYFSKSYTPFNEFKHDLFEGWNEIQWQLFDNFMMECVWVYLKCRKEGWGTKEGSGIIEPPMDAVLDKRYAALVAQPFMEWAELYFNPESGNLNRKIIRANMQEDYAKHYPDAKSVSSANFKKNLINYCKFKGWDLNRTKQNSDEKGIKDYSEWKKTRSIKDRSFIGGRIMANGTEYFIVSTPDSQISDFI